MSSSGSRLLDLASCTCISDPRIEAKDILRRNFTVSFRNCFASAVSETELGHWIHCGLEVKSSKSNYKSGKAATLETRHELNKCGRLQFQNGRGGAVNLARLRLQRCDYIKQDLGIRSQSPELECRAESVRDCAAPMANMKGITRNITKSMLRRQSNKMGRSGKDWISRFFSRAMTDDQEVVKREEELMDITPLETVKTNEQAVEIAGFDTLNGKSQDKRVQLRGQILGSYATNTAIAIQDSLPPEGVVVLMSCAVGLVTGAFVVLFNLGVHEIHDFVWKGIPSTGAAWLRTQAIENTWQQIVLVPVAGGVVVGVLNTFRTALDRPREENSIWSNAKLSMRQVLKTGAAAVSLGTGSSLGPEGPSVEIGASIANGVSKVLRNSRERKISLVSAGSAAGISSGFNAAVSGCFFAIESVLPGLTSADTTPSLTTSMVLLSSVLASVVSQAGLGSDPAFRIPAYEFRSATELPLYLLLGILCGGVSVAFTKGTAFATTMFESLQEATGLPDGFLPPLGGLCVGVIALAYPEVLYWGFENVDVLLESTWPWVQGPSAVLLLQLVGAKLLATSLCRGSGLVGGVYAPALFIGAALGSAYGSLASYTSMHADSMWHLDVLDVAAPQAYALVGMAAVLAGVCQVPLTAVLLLFELTRDYRIILPLMAAVGLSSWIASTFQRKKLQTVVQVEASELTGSVVSVAGTEDGQTGDTILITNARQQLSSPPSTMNGRFPSGGNELCSLEDSLCLTNVEIKEERLTEEIRVRVAMRTRFAAMKGDTTLREAMSRMLAEKEWCVLVINEEQHLEGLLTLADIQQEAEQARLNGLMLELEKRPISSLCRSSGVQFPLVTANPDMTLKTAQRLMAGRGLRQIPVVAPTSNDQGNQASKVILGLLDREGIKLACRTEATQRMLRMRGPVMGQSVLDGMDKSL